MNVKRCQIEGLVVIEPEVFSDWRGFFVEAWSRRRYAEAGIDIDFVQDNFSFSRRHVLRGLHLQHPNAQGKLVQVLQGEVFDVAVDLRRDSPTFAQWHGETLSAENRRQFYIPPGFAHGFAVTSENAYFQYKCTDYYSPRDEITVRWDDPEIAITWPIPAPQLSERDAHGIWLRDLPRERLYGS